MTGSPELRPPGNTRPPFHEKTESYRWLWLSLAIVLIAGLAVIFVLPKLVGPSQQTTTPVAAVANDGAARELANQSLQQYLQLRARLALAQADVWGVPDWNEADAAASNAKRLLAQRNFHAAAQYYGEALQTLQQLDSSRETRLAGFLQAGKQALADNEIATARQQFELALALQPEQPLALQGLQRAAVRTDVLHAMQTGVQAEQAGNLVAAQTAYQQAVTLDAAWTAADVALQRVSQQLGALGFRDAMTRALTALDAGRFSVAAKALDEAARLQPADAAVADARQRLAQARRQAQLNRLRRKAVAAVAAENWQVAADLYRQAQGVDDGAGFARDGLSRATERLQLHHQFDHYLDQPERVFSPRPLANARALLTAASQAPADEPKLAAKITELQQLVSVAGTPVAVTLQSDEQTEVAIYHVGKLGRFAEHRMELLPGNYTVVGTRAGYRDVRKDFMVRSGGSAPVVQIRCEEPI